MTTVRRASRRVLDTSVRSHGPDRGDVVGRRQARDTILSAISIEGALDLGTVFDGLEVLAGDQAAAQESVEALLGKLAASPRSLGHLLGAEAITKVLDLGKAYTGALEALVTKVKDASEDPDATEGERREAAGKQLEQMHRSVGTDPASERQAASEALRRSGDAIPGIRKPPMIGDGSKITPDAVKATIAKYWSEQRSLTRAVDAAGRSGDATLSRNKDRIAEQIAANERLWK